VSDIKKEIDQLKEESQEYERSGQLDKVAEIIYGKNSSIKKKLES